MSNRQLVRAVLNGHYSRWHNILSGVPQGSVLGPLLLVIYINDIDIARKILKFADDTKIYSVVNSTTDIENLRADLCNITSWARDCQMLFNV